MELTKHAQVRQKQRGIPQFIIDLLIDFGTQKPIGEGVISYFFDKASRRQLQKYLGRMSHVVQQYLDCYLLASSDGKVITIAHRVGRLRN